MTSMSKVAVVIPTLSVPCSVRDLLESICLQTLQPVEVVVVNQGAQERADAIVSEFAPKLNLRPLVSAPGLSLARNAGISALTSDWDVVAIPDDDVVYAADAFEVASHLVSAGHGIVAGRVGWADGRSRVKFPAVATAINIGNVWRTALEAGLFISRDAWRAGSGFSEYLGLGSNGPWQSGEGTDFLIRALSEGQTAMFSPNVVLTEQVPAPISEASRLIRLRKYARGTGAVYRRNYSFQARVALLARSMVRVAAAAIPGSSRQWSAEWAVLAGRWEGLVGRIREH